METSDNNRTTYLQQLSGSDFEIADHQPDITGWTITGGPEHKVGKVTDLIFDSNARKVRYIVANLSDGELDDSAGVLIPIGVVDLDRDNDRVILAESSAVFLNTLPEYVPGKVISPAEELAVRYAFLGQASLPDADAVVYEQHPDDFYTHDHFSERRFTKRISGETDEN